jgi:hypothetical protein
MHLQDREEVDFATKPPYSFMAWSLMDCKKISLTTSIFSNKRSTDN